VGSRSLTASPQPTPALITGWPTGPYQSAIGTALVGGWATFCDPTPERCQAWGPPALLGAVPWFRDGDRPFPVEVCVAGGAQCVVVTVVSFCACGDRDGIPTVIDLSPAALEQLDLDYRRLGVVFVTIEWPVDELPATDAEEDRG